MTAAENLRKLRSLLAAHLCLQEVEIEPESTFEDLGADSLDFAEIIMMIEEEWGVDIPDDEAEKLRTVQDSLDYIEENAE